MPRGFSHCSYDAADRYQLARLRADGRNDDVRVIATDAHSNLRGEGACWNRDARKLAFYSALV